MLEAVNEVRPPIIVATLVVMVSFLPMLFFTGMMGPYMQPMALNAPVAMFTSMVVAFLPSPRGLAIKCSRACTAVVGTNPSIRKRR